MALQIQARCTRKTSNALKLIFTDRPDQEPLAEAIQNGAGSRGSKVATLFGFKNGGSGNHAVKLRDGSEIDVKSGHMVPTDVTQPDGATVAVIERGDEASIARASGGTEILRFGPNPSGCMTPDHYRLMIQEPGGSVDIGNLDIVRTSGGWHSLEDIYWDFMLRDQVGQSLPIPFLGAMINLQREVTDLERNVVIAACTDVVIGLRPYVKEMQ